MNEIYVYAAYPIKKIVGKIIIEDIIKDVPEQLWKLYYRKAGICKKDFFAYFKGTDTGYAIKIKEFESFKEPIDPYKINPKFAAPQSFAYINNILPDINL